MISQATRRRIKGDRTTPAPVPLSERTVGDLLTAAYALTHRMDAAEHRAADLRLSGQFVAAKDRTSLAADLRTQRDLITAEVLRRTGDAR